MSTKPKMKSKHSGPSTLGKLYLIAYNGIQTVGYSTFLVLYPLGITGELLCMYHSLDEVAEKQIFSASMPNTWNFIFSYYYFLIFYMFLYIPLFPYLFGHMLKQRNKMLGVGSKKSA